MKTKKYLRYRKGEVSLVEKIPDDAEPRKVYLSRAVLWEKDDDEYLEFSKINPPILGSCAQNLTSAGSLVTSTIMPSHVTEEERCPICGSPIVNGLCRCVLINHYRE